jgi:hypothetical protein
MIIKSIVNIWRQVSTKLFLDTEGHLTAPKHYRYLAEIYAAITILNKAWVIPSTNKTPIFHYCLNNSLFYLNLSLILFIVLATDTSLSASSVCHAKYKFNMARLSCINNHGKKFKKWIKGGGVRGLIDASSTYHKEVLDNLA